MSNERIVNRVQPTQFFEQEMEKVGLQTAQAMLDETINQTVFDPLVEQAKKELTSEPEPVMINSADSSADLNQEFRSFAVDTMTATAIRLNRDYAELIEFKSRVLKAFRHLGLDTMKFFGE